MHINGNQDIITLNRGKGLKKTKQTNKKKKTMNSFSLGSLAFTCVIV